jgi:branched-chain amino acid transport system permease protein
MTPHLLRGAAPTMAGAILVALLPLLGNRYHLHLGTLIASYWVLIGGLNLVVGFTGVLSIGHVGLLAMGAYVFAILAQGGVVPEVALLVSGTVGGVCGALLGLPSLRLPGFYFAMATLAFTIIVVELAIALSWLTGGGTGISVSGFSGPFTSPTGQYALTVAAALIVTWMSLNVTRTMWGRAMIAVRDSEVMAASVGIKPHRVKLAVFTFSGVTAGIAGALFGALQSYVTPDTFAFDLSLLFFICIIIGGRGSVVGPFLGTVVLAMLPELVGPLAKLGHLLYGFLLLAIVLLLPGGLANAVKQRARERSQPGDAGHDTPDYARLAASIRVER